MNEPRVLAWVSGGAASIVAAKMAIGIYGPERVELVRCETGNEDPDNHRFEQQASAWLGKGVTLLRSERYESVWDVWQRRRYMAGPRGAPCTMFMKVEPRLVYQRPDDIHIFGYTADGRDRKRFESLRDNYFELTVRAPLVEAGITKSATLAIIQGAGIELPRSYEMGFPNANCLGTGCVKASSPGYWSLYRQHFPDRFQRMATYSRELGKRLVQIGGRRRFLDELPTDWPTLKPVAPACDFLCQHAEREIEHPTSEAPERSLRRPLYPSSTEGVVSLRDMLSLEGLVPKPAKSWEDDRKITIAISRRPDAQSRCSHCGSTAVMANGARHSAYADTPIRGKVVRLEWERQRFRCGQCHRTFSDQHPELHPTRQMTWRLLDWIGRGSVDRTFTDVAEEIDMSERAVSGVFDEWAQREFHKLNFATPRILALHEVKLLGRGRLILTAPARKTIIDMHASHTSESVVTALRGLHDPARVRVVSIRRNFLFRDAVQATLPQATIVVEEERGQTEIDSLIRIVDCAARGYAFGALKAKVILDQRAWVLPSHHTNRVLASSGRRVQIALGVNLIALEQRLQATKPKLEPTRRRKADDLC